MIRFLLMQQLDNKSFRDGRRITLNEVSKETGIARATLTRMANVAGYNANTDAIDALCRYFRCTPGELLEWVDEKKVRKKG